MYKAIIVNENDLYLNYDAVNDHLTWVKGKENATIIECRTALNIIMLLLKPKTNLKYWCVIL